MKRGTLVILNQRSIGNVITLLKFQGYWLGVSYWSNLPCLVQLLTWLHVSDSRNTIIFEELKDSSLKIDSLPYKQFFQLQKQLAKWHQHFVKIAFKKSGFLSKKSKFILNNTIWFKFRQHVVQTCIKNVWRNFRLAVSAFATVAAKNRNCNLAVKIDFRSDILCYHYWRWHWESEISPYIIW